MIKIRSSGILLPVQSLASKFGIGDLGPAAREFAQFLHAAGQHVWQILPVTPTEAQHGHSPYHSPSAFAFNPLLISPEQMAEHGFISKADLDQLPEIAASPGKIAYGAAWEVKKDLLARAFELHRKDPDFEAFCQQHAHWLNDYAMFSVLTRQYRNRFWHQWPPGLVRREPGTLAAAARQLAEPISWTCFLQYLFYRQWTDLREFCTRHNVGIMGDMPIYVPLHSADVWCRTELFKLDPEFQPVVVSGVPPDYFSDTGQLWGHPVYDWQIHEKQGFDWWISRIGHHLDLFDILRIDHFRGLVAAWEVPAADTTALNGKWHPVPVHSFFRALHQRFSCLPLVAEDLGNITADVREVMAQYDLPGMRVLVFGFNDDPSGNPNAPHNVDPAGLVYTGTHDTNTAAGWFENEATEIAQKRASAYFGANLTPATFARMLVRAAMMSPARLCILPIQDILALGQEARINHPATQKNNWLWRLTPNQLTAEEASRQLNLTRIYGRY